MTTLAVHADQPLEGVPLVLLHAFPLDSRMWDEVAQRLDGVPLVRVDAPGFGGSAAGEPGLEGFGLDVVAAIRQLGSDQAVVAGLSMGGYVAMALAERHAGLLAGLALLDTRSGADTEAARDNRLRVAEAVLAQDSVEPVLGMRTTLLGATSRATRPDLVEHLETWIGDQGPRGVAWAQRAMAARPDRTEVLGEVGCPALVVVGEEDELAPVDVARAMAEALACEVVVVPGAGHMTPIENPEPVAAALSALLQRAGG